MAPLIVRNLTMHRLSERELTLGREAGVVLEPEPFGIEAAPGEDGFLAAAEELAQRIAACALRGEGGLLGGYVALWVSALLTVMESGTPLPPLYYFETARLRDALDRFVFKPIAIRHLTVGARSAHSIWQQRPELIK